MLDGTSEFGQRAARRLREDVLAWLTTVDRRGTPQPVPVWFLWDGGTSILVYSRPDTPKLRSIEGNPRVSLHLDGNGRGGDIVVCLGQATHLERPACRRDPRVHRQVRAAHRAQPVVACLVRCRLLGAAAHHDLSHPRSLNAQVQKMRLRYEIVRRMPIAS